jgi:4-aminobutyrate aminotransferase / (S)-3-amino-2-methylpropionate transaminase / 5-aminovalerate transaminase
VHRYSRSGEPDPVATGELAKACHAEGMVVLTAGTYGNVLRCMLAKVFEAH